ncbi:MAG TPA: serine/threonine-protein kinase, partial [Verrucomicrobiae bacterium]|nr:serine/threonine-protein kinase [Verrucomicrobiae bacterium]
MDPDAAKPNSTEVETIFHAALVLSMEERERYLSTSCGQDAQLLRRVTSLLRAHQAAEGFLPENSKHKPTPPLPLLTPENLPESEKPGDQIGRYKLLQNIGEGGCGVVYMAEQQEPVRRRVALKVIKLGMDTRQVVARFEAERQALALMDHANIAKVLDAGATNAGRPFFVMELVRGPKITEYCDQNRLSTTERLDLFVQVCRAIEHAHQKGIIHRDIKPSNVLVTLHDGIPVPKVIDFGIAKATQGRLTDQTLFTAFEQFIGTPAYMSPEQAEMSGLDVDTRSDIYSLGVLLYELLTGKTPFDPKELMASGLDAMRQTIREKEPTRPSTMLSTMMAGELASAARQRRVEAPKLISSIEGDLEWIVMKCIEKDRTRRYENASALAADVLRFLNNEPILARPPSRLYLLQKLVHRHRFLVTSAAAVTVALLLGLSLSTWLWLAERKAHRTALAAEQKADDSLKSAQKSQAVAESNAKRSFLVVKLLRKLLDGVGPSVARGRDTTIMSEILSTAERELTSSLPNQPEVQAELRTIIGSVYLQLAEFTKAETQLRKALALR